MRSKYILAVLTAGFSLAIAAGGCGSDAEDGTGGSGNSPATSGTGATTTTGTMSTGGGMPTSSSTTGGDSNIDCKTAAMLEMNVLDSGEESLEPVEEDEDFFTFEGTAGQIIILFGDAKPDEDPFADGYPDLVFTLFNADGTQIAENDDPIPRNTQDSTLYTVLPEDGQYCVRVMDFCRWSDLKGQPCPTEQVIEEPGFRVTVGELDPEADTVVLHDEATEPTPMEYGKDEASTIGAYFTTVVAGEYTDADDVDTFTFTIPTDLPCNAQGEKCIDLAAMGDERTSAYVEIFPTGDVGNGSTVPTGKVWITDAAANKIGEVDGSKVDPTFGLTLNPPVTHGQPYTLHVQAPAGSMVGTNPFYFLIHYGGGSNPLEQETLAAMATNDTVATAEPMGASPTTGGGTGYFIAGTLFNDGDVDFYTFDNAALQASDVVFATCSGQRSGSAIRGLKVTVLDDAGATTIGAAPAETAENESTLGDAGATIPPSTVSMVLKVETEGAADSTITGRYYQCGVAFGTPQ